MSQNLIVRFELDGAPINFEGQDSPFSSLTVIPNVGDHVSFDWVFGVKVAFEVVRIDHHLSSIGSDILQQITVSGKSV